MPKISKITGELVLEINQWTAGIKQAQKDSKALSTSLAPIGSIATTIGKTLAGAGLALGAALATSVKIAADYADGIRDVSRQTGLATQTISGLKYAAEQSGASLSDVTSGLKFLAKNFTEAAEGGKSQAAAFARLGISARDLQAANGDLDMVMRLVMDRFAAMPDGAAKSTAALELFGKGGSKLTEVLSGGSAALDAAIKRMEFFGGSVTPQAGDAADAFNDALNDLKQAILGANSAIGGELMPTATQLVRVLTSVTVASRELATEWIKTAEKALAVGRAILGDDGLYTGLAAIVSIIPGATKLTTASANAYLKLTTEIEPAARASKTLAETVGKAVKEQQDAEEAAKKWRTSIEDLKDSILGTDTKTKQWVQALKELDRAGKINADTLESLRGQLDKLKNSGADVVVKLRDQIAAQDMAAFSAKILAGAELNVRLESATLAGEAFTTARALEQMAAAMDSIEAPPLRELNSEVAELAKQTVMASGEFGLLDQTITDTMAAASANTKHTTLDMGRLWSDMTVRMAENLADMIVDADFSFKGLLDIAKNVAKQMLSAFISGLLAPLTARLQGLGASLSGALGGIGGGGGGGGGGGTGGPGLGTALLGGGIIAGIGILTTLIGKIGQGRRTADEFVGTFQNPFGSQLQSIHTQFQAGIAAGTLTAQAASDVVAQVSNLWQQFQQQSQIFASQSSTHATVVNQAMQTLSFVTQLIADMQSQVNQLQNAPQLAMGTTYVPSNGLYRLHQGEAVVPKDQNGVNGLTVVIQGAVDPDGLMQTVRTRMIPALKRVLSGNVDGFGDAVYGTSGMVPASFIRT